jgi:hypothetical protein
LKLIEDFFNGKKVNSCGQDRGFQYRMFATVKPKEIPLSSYGNGFGISAAFSDRFRQ